MVSQYEMTDIAGVDPCQCNRIQMKLLRTLNDLVQDRRTTQDKSDIEAYPLIIMDLLENFSGYEDKCVPSEKAEKIIEGVRSKVLQNESLTVDEAEEYLSIFMYETPLCGRKD